MIAQNSIVQNKWAVSPHCKLLLHMDGANDGQVFNDVSPSAHTVTAGGTACTKTSTKRFGGSSAYISSSTSDKLTLSSTDFTSIKTISFWFYRVGAWSGYPCLFQSGSAATNGYFQYSVATGMDYHQPSNAKTGTFGFPTVDIWHHYVATCDGTNATFYVDGVQVNQAAYTGVFFTNSAIQIGNYQSLYPAVGYFDEVAFFSEVIPIEDLYPARAPLYDYAISEWGGQ